MCPGLGALPAVEPPGYGASEWRYRPASDDSAATAPGSTFAPAIRGASPSTAGLGSTRRVDRTDIRSDDRSLMAKALGYQLSQHDRTMVRSQCEAIFGEIRRLATRARRFTTPVELAIDVHDWLLYGDADTAMVTNRNPDSGTNRAFTFVSTKAIRQSRSSRTTTSYKEIRHKPSSTTAFRFGSITVQASGGKTRQATSKYEGDPPVHWRSRVFREGLSPVSSRAMLRVRSTRFIDTPIAGADSAMSAKGSTGDVRAEADCEPVPWR